jgi:D-arginine dehydrogenase
VHALHQGYLRGAPGGWHAALRCRVAVAAQRETAAGGCSWPMALASLPPWSTPPAPGPTTLAARCGVAPLGIQPRRRSAFTFERRPAWTSAPGHWWLRCDYYLKHGR